MISPQKGHTVKAYRLWVKMNRNLKKTVQQIFKKCIKATLNVSYLVKKMSYFWRVFCVDKLASSDVGSAWVGFVFGGVDRLSKKRLWQVANFVQTHSATVFIVEVNYFHHFVCPGAFDHVTRLDFKVWKVRGTLEKEEYNF